jgi:hypothetical protein
MLNFIGFMLFGLVIAILYAGHELSRLTLALPSRLDVRLNLGDVIGALVAELHYGQEKIADALAPLQKLGRRAEVDPVRVANEGFDLDFDLIKIGERPYEAVQRILNEARDALRQRSGVPPKLLAPPEVEEGTLGTDNCEAGG